MTQLGTGGGCQAVHIPCGDGTYLLITAVHGDGVPVDDAHTVIVGRQITHFPPPAGNVGAREVRTCDLEGVINAGSCSLEKPVLPASVMRRRLAPAQRAGS